MHVAQALYYLKPTSYGGKVAVIILGSTHHELVCSRRNLRGNPPPRYHCEG